MSLLAVSAAACSSEVTRFDRSLYSSAAQTAAPDQYSQNAYPPGVDGMPTASIRNGAPVPAEGVDAQSLESGHPGPAYPAPAYSGDAQPVYPQPQATGAGAYGQPAGPGSGIQRQTLPALAPSTVDPVRTSSVGQVAAVETRVAAPAPAAIPPAAPAVAPGQRSPAGGEKGWTATGGTSITLREGETLYNLSKRYGVPVKAIMQANGIVEASSVQAGSRVVIPTYVYSRGAPVSAPDNDPRTVGASAARGPMAEPARAEEAAPVLAPARPAQAGERPSAVTVQSGDTLTRIAARHGVSIAALRSANGLASDNIRIGQKLVLPGASIVAAPPAAPAVRTDPVVTASPVAPAARPAPASAPAAPAAPRAGEVEQASTDLAAPARTGIEEFRWPVRGRVISAFGDKTAVGRNDGIDISVPEGTAVKAAENGVVVYAGDELEGFGNLVLIRHSGGWVSAYGHNKLIDVKRGEEVKRGQTIARSGRTGSAEMPKLHFELRKGSTPVDPIKHLGG